MVMGYAFVTKDIFAGYANSVILFFSSEQTSKREKLIKEHAVGYILCKGRVLGIIS